MPEYDNATQDGFGESTDEDTDKPCPECGDPIEGIERQGVSGNATVRPCGHDIGALTVRELHGNGPRIATDGGVDPTTWTELTGFRREILKSIAHLDSEGTTTYGLAIKRELESRYGKEVNHGRLYPNLDSLANKGLVAKSELDKRTNEYELTDEGGALLLQALLDDQHLVDELGGTSASAPPEPAVSGGDD